ncbi:NAD(P)-binding protein [Aspergillus aculeatinus CBS 121060]|uniref:NAD(P)-binding protein n=1 Tax=Aspergillus aculeatinus CBS 121060 TaxID=1448322 RepID=A0ACD1H1N6_9EURO|nr:NAD(P)-binding protein [Aspergillus aculeatinus CBS 121060]RAH67480.1 NAD(P)-binding protein [Aspergillus aculeatinus CBS 121060]
MSHDYHLSDTWSLFPNGKYDSAACQCSAVPSAVLSLVIMPDIAVPGAFDHVVVSVSGVIHTASPFVLEVSDNENNLLQPAIRGTLNIAHTIHTCNPSVRRLVITSSFAVVLDLDQGFRPTYRYTEADWNPCSYEITQKTSNSSIAYCASRAFAERYLWEWVTENQPNFTVATICPPWIFGPTIDVASKRNESTEVIMNLVNGSQTEVPENDFAAFANVEDVAQAHLRAYVEDLSAHERFIVAGGAVLVSGGMRSVPRGISGTRVKTYIADGSNAARVLGLEYRNLEETLVETVEDLQSKDMV